MPYDPVAGQLYPEAGVLHASNRFCSRLGEWGGIFEDVCRMNVSSYLIPDPWGPNSTTNCTNEAQRRQDEAYGDELAKKEADSGTGYESNGTHFVKKDDSQT